MHYVGMDNDNENTNNDTVYGPAIPPDSAGDGKQEQPHEPILNIPPITGALLAVLLLVYGVTHWVMSDDVAQAMVLYFSFIPYRVTTAGWHDVMAYGTVLSYMLLHGNMLHILMNGSMLLSLGAGVEKVLGGTRFFWFFILCGIVSILFQYVFGINDMVPLIGASGAISGLFGAVIILMQKIGHMKSGLLGIAPVVIIWSIINVVIGMMGIPGEEGASIAWLAHLGGFYAGLVLFPLFLKRP